MSSFETFSEFVRRAAGSDPYPYQTVLAERGLPDLLRAPTGTGKTLAAVLPWLYRRREHPDASVRHGTPRRLVVVLPQRSLVEQTVDASQGWLDRLQLQDQVGLHVLMGGLSQRDREWELRPERDAIFVGTQDMVLSRLLMRGYAESRANWPISFGLLHADTQFVFDEVQLMGPALPTSLQLAGLREALGVAVPCRTMWMSATVDRGRFDTVDFGGIRDTVELAEGDRSGPLRQRLSATRTVVRAEVDADPKRYPQSLATLVLQRHVPGTRTLVVLNTVDRATQVYDALLKRSPGAATVLVHSRFRPVDRAAAMAAALGPPGPAGTVAVATQVLEAGVDVDSRLLVTETAPWSAVVQRAGRCNRAGDHPVAHLLWTDPPAGKAQAAPYDEEDLARTADALLALEGQEVTSSQLQDLGVDEARPMYPVLRRRDLLDLFDTAADLSGNDLDVGRWIRDADAATASACWRDPGPEGSPADASAPAREELCPAPLTELRDFVGTHPREAWIFDQFESRWRPARRDDVRPGAVLVLSSGQGGYLPDRGWSPDSTEPVRLVQTETEHPDGMGSDTLTAAGRWVTLADHLEDVRREVGLLLGELGELPGLAEAHRDAATHAGLLHDLGKVHDVFAASLRRTGEPPGPGPWAKSSGHGQLRHRPPGFRHELVSALMLLDPSSGLLDGVPEPDLVAYLVAAHHGKVRLSARASPTDDSDRLLGVGREEHTPPITLPDGRFVPALRLQRDVFEVGRGATGDSWQARACRLRDREDLGSFRLAFLEALVRVADWRASAAYDQP